MLMELE